ncbi:hypothetical protein [Rheinheimera soli]|uniref:hypothetical protein n=1 Tax=Rheinheimera soli TaxID=443616 RepID=UPI001E603E46|nr:hypothetical protein [Rheinheimera soli]
MKSIIFCGIGAGLGSATYQTLVHGISETDWYRAIFVGLFTMLFYGLYVGFKRLTSKDKDA